MWSLQQDQEIVFWYNNSPKDWEPKIKQSVFAWGSGSHGQLAEMKLGRLEPDLVTTISSVRSVVCGQNCTFVIHTNGTVQACGEGSYGRLGQGTSDDETTPTPISDLQGDECCLNSYIYSLTLFFFTKLQNYPPF